MNMLQVMPTILIADIPGNKGLPAGDVVNRLFPKAELICVSSNEATTKVLEASSIDIMISNHPEYEIFKLARSRQPNSQLILATDRPMKDYSAALENQEEQLLDHIIATRSLGHWMEQELQVTIKKILHPSDIFGIAKYLIPNADIKSYPITGSKDRETLNNSVMEFAANCRLGHHLSKLTYGITEELLMNAIHDAPLAGGIMEYANQPRNTPVTLKPEEYGELCYAFDGRTFAISAADPFGALNRETLFQYLKKVLRRQDSVSLIDTKKGGAGLGLFKILYSCHGIVCNIDFGKKTELIALIDVREPLRDFNYMPRSVHYFNALNEAQG